ncbi:MAG: hypothetical protein CM1200mP14_10770 [Gammaproteobacteria bacterium]|nr:MAG: hypothetical protein CM1200mP14_10770 [Gammaproteobacteria bacterium]
MTFRGYQRLVVELAEKFAPAVFVGTFRRRIVAKYAQTQDAIVPQSA